MSRSPVARRLLLPVVAAVLLAACGGSASPTGSVDCRGPVNGVLTVTVADRQFDTGCLALPAGEAVTIRLVNDDIEPHNLALYTDSDKGTELYAGEIIDGGETVDYDLDPLEAGTFYFDCTVHPDMYGSVVVE
jgi:plastocyanin